jgi:hypothetical protein
MIPRRRFAVLALVAAACGLGACGDAPGGGSATPIISPHAAFAAEEARFAALLEKPWASVLLPVKLIGERRAALNSWLADRAAADALTGDSRAAAEARLAETAAVLAARSAPLASTAAAAEAVRDALDQAWERRRALGPPLAVVARHGPAPITARVDAWNAALRDAENALKRSLAALATGATREGVVDRDLNIAAGGFAAAEREGATLAAELGRFAGTAAEVEKRRDLFAARLAWAERVAAATAGTSDEAALREPLAVARKFAAEELPPLVAETLRSVGACEPAAFDAHGRVARAVDAALVALQTPFRPVALRLGLGDPP